ncbi:essential MCU regulator, mitochondrial [Coccinella septempunctata]|uniref:essential MCU regulator, mitochondrial n=1 Tax=Coccinella septempunctata TaxID=41139 RepID=UPI001D05D051|nr:essential MCU regulator, mitochondrial [Coccinella septempunctata]
MLFPRFKRIGKTLLLLSNEPSNSIRTIKTKHGIIHPEPKKVSFGIIRVLLTIASGLFVGAMISKNIANFLEENDLFVPSDDDDDDD